MVTPVVFDKILLKLQTAILIWKTQTFKRFFLNQNVGIFSVVKKRCLEKIICRIGKFCPFLTGLRRNNKAINGKMLPKKLKMVEICHV